MDGYLNMNEEQYKEKALKLRLLLTDVDGVLTDNGVYYWENGEVLKRFSIRDGMGVERLRNLCGIDTGIVTGEWSPSVTRRAEKLQIRELHLGVKDKAARLEEIVTKTGIAWESIAFIGDDVNDLDVLKRVGLSACPSDAMPEVSRIVDYRCGMKGGDGAFREFAEWIIAMRSTIDNL